MGVIMVTKQLSVFIENRKGRLDEVLSVLKENGVNIISMSLADTQEYGLLRLIVTNASLGKEKLLENGFSSLLTDVFVIKIAHETGNLQTLLKVFSDKDINIDYMYGLSVNGGDAYIVLKTSQLEITKQVLKENNVQTLTEKDIEKL